MTQVGKDRVSSLSNMSVEIDRETTFSDEVLPDPNPLPKNETVDGLKEITRNLTSELHILGLTFEQLAQTTSAFQNRIEELERIIERLVDVIINDELTGVDQVTSQFPSISDDPLLENEIREWAAEVANRTIEILGAEVTLNRSIRASLMQRIEDGISQRNFPRNRQG